MSFENKSLMELVKFYNEDWEKEKPTLTDNSVSNKWSVAMKEATRTATELQVIEALHEWRDIDFCLDEEMALRESLREVLMYSERERLSALENSVKVLLKQSADELANITVGQLNRLKRGIPIQ